MSGQPARDKPVLVTVPAQAASLNAVWWAADYARHRGLPLRLVPTSAGNSSIVDLIRVRFSDVVVQHISTASPLIDTLVDESETAHLIVVGTGSLVTRLSARARCPVVAVPLGAEWSEPVQPVVVGVQSPAVLSFAFDEADRLGVGVKVVRCAPEHASAEAISLVTARYPDVPVRVEGTDRSPARALAWHAHFGSMVVVGSQGEGRLLGALSRSVSRAVLRHASGPVVVIGPHAIAASEDDQAVPDFDTARS